MEIPQFPAGFPSKREGSFVSSRIWSSQIGPGLAQRCWERGRLFSVLSHGLHHIPVPDPTKVL